MTRRRSRLSPLGVLITVAFVPACGTTSPHDSQRSAMPPHRQAPLVYVWRNFEETGIPEEMTVYADGEVRYRNLLHTQHGIRVITGRLAPPRLTRIRRALDAVDLSHADAAGIKPPRAGYRYVIRSDGRAGTAVDGHLPGPIRPLLLTLGAEMDRLQQKSF